MNNRRPILSSLTGIAASLCVAAVALGNGTLLRWHKMGEEEGGTNNSVVGSTLDSPIDGSDVVALDLGASNSPVYRTITGRPDGGTGIGIEFSGASQQFLAGFALNWPEQSALDVNHGGQYDLTGIDDRSFQLWVRPTSTAAQSIVLDTNQHGLRISENGKFSMRYGSVDYESGVSVVPNAWYHVQVARPAGVAGGSRMFINGSAAVIAVPANDYSADAATFMSVGATVNFDGEFYSGIMDDLRMQVYGTSTGTTPVNYGTFNLLTDNAYVASLVSGLKGVAGDVTNDGFLTQADKDAFITGWMKKRLVSGIQIGDMTSHANGDLNLDGITNIQDLLLMQNALTSSGMGTISPGDLAGVPEPSTLVLLVMGVAGLLVRPRRR